MLIKHLRDVQRVPFATIVGMECGIGVAICNNKDHFSKKMGVNIASGRAMMGTFPNIPKNRYCFVRGSRHNTAAYVTKDLQSIIDDEVAVMAERIKRYYAEKV